MRCFSSKAEEGRGKEEGTRAMMGGGESHSGTTVSAGATI